MTNCTHSGFSIEMKARCSKNIYFVIKKEAVLVCGRVCVKANMRPSGRNWQSLNGFIKLPDTSEHAIICRLR